MKKQITPCLTFNGNAREAVDFYSDIFGAEVIQLQTFGEADYPTPPEASERIMHARLTKGEMLIMISDTFPDHSVEIGSNLSLALELESEEEIQKLYDRLIENGTSSVELQDTFWGAKYAKVKDKYGVIWELNYMK